MVAGEGGRPDWSKLLFQINPMCSDSDDPMCSDSDDSKMNRHEESALGDPVLAGIPVYDLDGHSCLQTSSSGRQVDVSGQANMVT